MDEKTLKALKGSIKKWERIAAGTGVDKGDDNCPLCKVFKADSGLCRGCPVAENSGVINCGNTPYKQWLDAENDIGGRNRNKATTPLLKQAAQAELDFLKSLLPTEALNKTAE